MGAVMGKVVPLRTSEEDAMSTTLALLDEVRRLGVSWAQAMALFAFFDRLDWAQRQAIAKASGNANRHKR